MAIKLIRKVYNLLHPIQGEIWCLHRVIENRSDYPSNRELEITPDYFETLIKQCKADGYRFVSIDQLLGAKSIISKKRINISFDDGFRDVYTNAYPILKEYKIPFTVYLTTDFPEGNADIWWVQLERMTSVEEFERIMKSIYDSGRPMADKMHEITGTKADFELCHSLSLSWEEITEMIKSGLCTVGSHTVSHQGLTRIGINDCKRELTESRRIIKERIGIDAIHFSYPHSMQNDAVQREVSDAGFISATLGYGGSIRKGDGNYLLNRKYITQG